MRKFILKATFYVILILGGFELLYRLGVWPCITDSSTYDHKMLWLQQHPSKKAELMAVGSSVPMYGLSSSSIVGELPLSYYNFSSWNLRITDCWITIKPMVREYRPKYVLLGTNLGDFVAGTDSTYFDYIDAASFIRRDLPELFYFTHFTSIHQLLYRWFRRKDVRFDQWGGLRLEGAVLNDHLAGVPQDPMALPFDPQYRQMHYRALDSLSGWLRDQHVQLIYVQFPIPAKSMAADAVRAKVIQHIQTCKAIVEKNGGIFLNYLDALPQRDSLFVGALHLAPPGADLFTGMLVSRLKKIIGKER